MVRTKRTPEPTLTAERWFLSVCYPKAYFPGQVDHWDIGLNGLEVPAYTYRQVCDRSDN